jgi:GGDEF domain-containing protein
MSEFEVVLRKEFARAARYRESFALLLLDLSPTGEALGSTRDGVRLCDSVIAAGGSRVAVVLPQTSLAGALQVATRLGETLAPPEGSATVPPLAIGISVYPSAQAGDAAACLRSAESALEQARSRGGGVACR